METKADLTLANFGRSMYTKMTGGDCMADNEILEQILSELKGIKESQAVLEHDVREVRTDQQVTQINIDKLSRNQASVEQGLIKLQKQVSDVEEGQVKLQKQVSDIEEGLQTVRNSQLKVELEQYPRISVALDGFESNKEKNDEQDKRIEYLEKKTDIHDTRLYSLETSIKKAL